MLNNNI